MISFLRNFVLLLFSHRFLAIARWEFHFLQVRIWNTLTWQKSLVRKALSQRPGPLFLNLGSGPRGINDLYWVNVDGFRDRNVNYLIDCSRELPFPDESFAGVFCEHVIEHFSLADGERIAREVLRVLHSGGRFRIIVPDAELVLQRYFDAPKELVSWRGTGSETPMEIVNLYFHQRYEHQFVYDWETMERMLLRAGFGNVCRSSFGHGGQSPRLVLDDEKYEWESLYVEAYKL